LVEDKVLNLNFPDDTLSQVDIDLGKYMDGKFGHFVLIVEPPAGMFESDNDKWRRFSQTIITWVQITQIGLDAYNDYSDMVVWATDLKDGSPLAGVQIQPNNGGAGVTSAADGVAHLSLPTSASYLVASQGADRAILPRSTYYWSEEGWAVQPPSDTLRWYVFDDRQMYRPGEEVHVKGWLRRVGGKQNGDVGLVGEGLRSITYKIVDPQNNALGDGQAEVNALGGFDFVFTLPETTNLGNAQITLNAVGDLERIGGNRLSAHAFQIQEFRRP
jgi:uncharacterized protein YfaS (alpha-2-macroglobulin family)